MTAIQIHRIILQIGLHFKRQFLQLKPSSVLAEPEYNQSTNVHSKLPVPEDFIRLNGVPIRLEFAQSTVIASNYFCVVVGWRG